MPEIFKNVNELAKWSIDKCYKCLQKNKELSLDLNNDDKEKLRIVADNWIGKCVDEELQTGENHFSKDSIKDFLDNINGVLDDKICGDLEQKSFNCYDVINLIRECSLSVDDAKYFEDQFSKELVLQTLVGSIRIYASVRERVENLSLSVKDADDFYYEHKDDSLLKNLSDKVNLYADTYDSIDYCDLSVKDADDFYNEHKDDSLLKNLSDKVKLYADTYYGIDYCSLSSKDADKFVNDYKKDSLLKNLSSKVKKYSKIRECIEDCSLSSKNADDFSDDYKKDLLLGNLSNVAYIYADICYKIEECTLSINDANEFCSENKDNPLLKNLSDKVNEYIDISNDLKNGTLKISDGAKFVNDFSGENIFKPLVEKVEEYCNKKNSTEYSSEKRHDRRSKSEDLSIYFDGKSLEEWAKKAPKCAQDPDNGKGLPFKHSGVYLWAKGYDVVEFLGYGGFGVVWKCRSKKSGFKAMKVLMNKRNSRCVDEEITSVEKLEQIIKADKTGRAEKYLNFIKKKSDTLNNKYWSVDAILKSPLADSDVDTAIELKQDKKFKKGKTIDSTLRKCIQALKATKMLHDAGYSHNDIKPQNFLKISNWKGKKKEIDKISNTEFINNILLSNKYKSDSSRIVKIRNLVENKKEFETIQNIINNNDIDDAKKVRKISKLVGITKIHKSRTQLSDFGTLTKIDDGNGIGTFFGTCTKMFVSELERNVLGEVVSSKQIKKRDVYALGITFLIFLSRDWNLASSISEILQDNNSGPQIAAEYFKKQNIYNGTSEENIIAFLELIKKMIDENWSTRITIEQALTEIQTLKFGID